MSNNANKTGHSKKKKTKENCTNSEKKKQPYAKETKQFWSKIKEQKELARKTEWINNLKIKLQGFEEDTTEIVQNNTKKVSNWTTPGHDGKHGFWFTSPSNL